MALDLNGNYVAETQPTTAIPVAPTAATVYSADNIAAAVASPAPTLDLSNTSSIYDYYLKGEDVTKAQTTYQADRSALAKVKATAASRQLAIEQNPLEGMSYIVGAQSRAGQLDSAQISALSDAAGVSQSAYLAAKETATTKANLAISQHDQLTSLIVNNPGAKIKYTDTVEDAAKKIEKYTEEKADDDYKDKLKETARSLGISTKGKNTKALEKAISKKNKEALAQTKESAALDLAYKKAQIASLNKKKIGSDASDQELLTYADMISRGNGDKVPSKYYADAWNLLSDEEKDNAIASAL